MIDDRPPAPVGRRRPRCWVRQDPDIELRSAHDCRATCGIVRANQATPVTSDVRATDAHAAEFAAPPRLRHGDPDHIHRERARPTRPRRQRAEGIVRQAADSLKIPGLLAGGAENSADSRTPRGGDLGWLPAGRSFEADRSAGCGGTGGNHWAIAPLAETAKGIVIVRLTGRKRVENGRSPRSPPICAPPHRRARGGAQGSGTGNSAAST